MANDLNLSIYRCLSASANPQTIIFRLQDMPNLTYNTAAADTVELVTSLCARAQRISAYRVSSDRVSDNSPEMRGV